eukprot:EG_transcript_24134
MDLNAEGLFHPRNVSLGPSPTCGGDGVFAAVDFPEGSVVEMCPSIAIKPVPVDHPLFDLLYSVGDGQHKAVVLGYGLMYNSSQCPNVRVERFPGGMFGFLAARAVRQGEELFVAPGERWCDGLEGADHRAVHSDQTKLYQRWNIRLGPSPIGGRGVFAARDFQAGEVVEVCPTVAIPPVPPSNPLNDYVFVAHDGVHDAVVLGYGFMYNSSHDPNVALERRPGGLFRYVALQPVSAGEELLINYGLHWWNDPAHQHLQYNGPE